MGQWANKRQNNFLESPSELLKSKFFFLCHKKRLGSWAGILKELYHKTFLNSDTWSCLNWLKQNNNVRSEREKKVPITQQIEEDGKTWRRLKWIVLWFWENLSA